MSLHIVKPSQVVDLFIKNITEMKEENSRLWTEVTELRNDFDKKFEVKFKEEAQELLEKNKSLEEYCNTLEEELREIIGDCCDE